MRLLNKVLIRRSEIDDKIRDTLKRSYFMDAAPIRGGPLTGGGVRLDTASWRNCKCEFSRMYVCFGGSPFVRVSNVTGGMIARRLKRGLFFASPKF